MVLHQSSVILKGYNYLPIVLQLFHYRLKVVALQIFLPVTHRSFVSGPVALHYFDGTILLLCTRPTHFLCLK